MNSGSYLGIQINGAAPATGYDQLKVNGSVTIAAGSLVAGYARVCSHQRADLRAGGQRRGRSGQRDLRQPAGRRDPDDERQRVPDQLRRRHRQRHRADRDGRGQDLDGGGERGLDQRRQLAGRGAGQRRPAGVSVGRREPQQHERHHRRRRLQEHPLHRQQLHPERHAARHRERHHQHQRPEHDQQRRPFLGHRRRSAAPTAAAR